MSIVKDGFPPKFILAKAGAGMTAVRNFINNGNNGGEKMETCSHHNHEHHHLPLSNKRRLVIVIFFNIIITMAEFIGGILSGSLALVSDAWHNLTDVLSLMLAYAGEKVSELDITRSYSFGFKRFEVMIALVNASSLTLIGIYIVYEAIKRFINPLPINIGIMVPVGIIGLLGNFFSILVLKTNRDHNLNTKAAFAHLLYDALSSIAVIVGGIIVYISGFLWIDLAVSLIIVIMILFNSASIIRESLRIFMQGTPPEIDPTIVFNSISGIAHVSNVHGLHIWSISSREIFLSCHICLDSTDAGINTDQIIKEVNDMLKEKYNIEHTTIQVEKQQICSLESGECCR